LPNRRLQGRFISFKILKVKKLCLLYCLFASKQLVAQTGRDTLNFLPPAIPPSVFAVETTEDMAIDGKLTEVLFEAALVPSQSCFQLDGVRTIFYEFLA
jgi:hypothetical protein